MRFATFCVLAAAWLGCSGLSRADGLVYQLPPDGGQVTYDIVIKAGPPGNPREMKGTMRMGSVGTLDVAGEKCRWIETRLAFAVEGQERVILTKSLVPEKHLGRGKSAAENAVRSWIKVADQEVMPLSDLKQPGAGPLKAFLAGPSANARKLDKATVDNAKLGKLECEGEVAEYDFEEGDGRTKMTFEHRFADKAPFGVVGSKLIFKNEKNGAVVEEGEVTFVLTDTNTTALTELPNNN